MTGWTADERDYRTAYGTIHYGGPCRDDYANLVTYDQGGGHTILTLQRPAMKAFKAAQVRYAKKSGWSKTRLENNLDGRPIFVIPGTNRTCSTQSRLYASDSARYASPNVTGHTRGLAIDIVQDQPYIAFIDSALAAEGWHRVRPDDEPWHWSFFVEV